MKSVLIRIDDDMYEVMVKKKRNIGLTWLELLYNGLDIKTSRRK